MTKEMYAANVKNWLMELAIGAKAAQRTMQFADREKDREWEATARCYDMVENGVAIHNLKNLAEAIEEPVKFVPFTKGDYFYNTYDGYYCIDMFGVRFFDYGQRLEDN